MEKNEKKMKKIGIDLNDVIRDFLGQLEIVYNKYQIGQKVSLNDIVISSFDFETYFPVGSGKKDYNKFLYEDCPLEIFGHADIVDENLITLLNEKYFDYIDDNICEFIIVSKEAGKSIPATHFFLSKINCQINKVLFYQDDLHLLNDVDFLITANPLILSEFSINNNLIKIKQTYNENVICQFEYENLAQILKNDEIITIIKNTNL